MNLSDLQSHQKELIQRRKELTKNIDKEIEECNQQIINHEKKIQAQKKRKRENIFGKPPYNLSYIGRLLKSGDATKQDFYNARQEDSNFDNNKLTYHEANVLDIICDISGNGSSDDSYNDGMFAVFYNFKTDCLSDYSLDDYDRLMDDPYTINLYAK